MDPLQHLCAKLSAEQIHQSLRQQHNTPATAPPPYMPADADIEDDDSSDSEIDDPSSPSPLKLTINAAHSIQGSHNLVPTSPTPLADATKFSTMLLAAVQQINAASEGPRRARRGVKVDLTINCGITVIGDRNVIGNVGLKPKTATPAATQPAAGSSMTAGGQASGGAAAVAGAKRKHDDGDDSEEDEREVKKVAVGGE